MALLRIEIEDAWDVSGEEEQILKAGETQQLYERVTKSNAKTASVFSLRNVLTGLAAIFMMALASVWLLRDQVEVYDQEGLVRLADNSMVELREGSRLEVISISDENRRVMLEGEAYFDVEENPNSPFIISVSNSKVEVLGTEFLVKEADKSVFVEVKEGRVRLSNSILKDSIDLTAGMKAKSDENGNIQTVEYQNLMGWKNGVFQYDGQEMSYVVEELGIIFNTTIRIENQQLLNCPISAILPAENLEDVINQLAGQFKMNANQNGKNWTLSGGKCK